MNLKNLSEVDFAAIGDQFRGLNPNDPGAWPPAPRLAVLVGLFVAILAGGWFLLWSDQITSLESKQAEEEKLKTEYVDKKKQAVNLDLYVQQLSEIDRSFGALLKQLPNRSEVDALLVEVNQAGLGRGLQFDLFKPGAEAMREFYAELPVQLKLAGSYHDFGAFAADIGRLSRIVTLSNVSIQPPPQQQGQGKGDAAVKGDVLVMEAVAQTYRYLDEEEVNKQRKAAKGGAKK